MKNPTADIQIRLQNVISILTPVLYWLAVTAVTIGILILKFAKYLTPIVIEHVTLQMGRKVYPSVNLDNYFINLE